MAETIERVIVNKITKAKFDELVDAGTITPAMVREQTWIFTDDQYVSSSNITDWNSKQPALVSGTNIKTINSQSILGSGDLSIEGQAFKGYIKDNNYINLNNYDPGVYYVLEGTTYSLVNNPGPSQRRMFNNYLIFLSTGYTLVIEKKVADVNVGDVFAYAYGFAQNSDGLKAETVQFIKSAATSTYGFSFNDIVSSTTLLPPVVSTNQTQTISAKKTFTVLPESSVTPQANEQLVNKKYVDDSIPTVPTNVSAFTNDAGYITGINSGDVTTALGYTPVNPNVIGVADGIAELDSTGKVPSAQLPSFVDDVIEGYYNTVDGKFYEESTYTTEIPGESGKIYVDLTTNKTYRWGGSAFAEISESLALGTTSTTAFRGDHGEVAYQHALSPHAKIVNVESGRYESASTPFELGGLKAGLYLFECNGGVNPTVYFTYGGSTAESMEVSPGFNTLYIPADIPLYADNTYGVEDVLGVFYGNVLDETNKTIGCVDSQLLFDDHMSAHMYIDSLVNTSLTLPTKTSDLNNDSGFITGMTILSYGTSTWNDFINAYNANKVVYCRASSNSNPATGSQNRLAFMAYVNNSTPTEVEFQYYRSVATHTDSQQGDQVYVYKLNSSGTWSVTVRESYTKIVAGTNMTSSYNNGTLTLNATGADLSNIVAADYDSTATYNVGDYVIYNNTLYKCNTDITTAEAWDSTHWTAVTLDTAKQDTLVSGTNIKTINGNSLLGSGDITIQGGGGTSIYDLSDLLAVTTPADQVYVDILADIQDNAEIRILNTISATQEELYTVIKSEYDPTPGVPSYVYYFDKQNKYTKLTLTDDGTAASITKSVENDFLFYNKALNSQTVSGWGSDIRCWINSNQWSSNKFVIEGKPTGIYLFDAIAPYSGSYVPQKIAGATNATGYLDVLGIQFMIIIKDYTSASAGETVALWWGAGKAGPQYGTLRKQAVNNAYPAGLQGGNDNNSSSEIYVNLLLAQTIAGKKTFTTLPETSLTPTKDAQLTRKKYVDDSVATKQDTLVSGTNIKTVNGNSLLGSGDLVISGGSSKYVGTITGDGATTSFTITHNLDSRDVIVQVYDDTSYETVIVDVTRDTVNTVQIDFTTAPILDKVYKVVVM